MRRQIGMAALAIAALAMTVGCTSETGQSGQSSGANDSIVIGMTYIPNVQFSPVYVAAEQGIFAENGVNASIRHHGTDEGLFTALVAGDEQITIAFGDELLQARSSGADLVSIGAYYHQYPVEIVVPADSEIESLEDLRGKKVGLPGEYGSNWFGLLAALESVGLTTDDIQVVSVGYTQAAALVAGDVDAIVGFANSEAVQLKQMDVATRALTLDPDQTPLVGASIVTSREWLDRNPDRARGAVGAITDGIQRILDDPEVGFAATTKWDETLGDPASAGGARATLEATLPLWTAESGKASAVQDLDTWRLMGPFLAGVLGDPSLAEQVEPAVTNDYTD